MYVQDILWTQKTLNIAAAAAQEQPFTQKARDASFPFVDFWGIRPKARFLLLPIMDLGIKFKLKIETQHTFLAVRWARIVW